MLQGISRLGGGPAPALASAAGTPAAGGGKAGALSGGGTAAVGAPAAAPTVPVEKILDPRRLAPIENKMSAGDSDGAKKEADSLIEKDPKDAKAWFYLGRINEKKGNLDEASVAYRMAFNLKDSEAKDAMNQVDLSRIQPFKAEAEKQEAAGNWVGAASSWKEATTVAPHLVMPLKKLVECMQKMGADAKDIEKVMKKLREVEKE